jgi:hypothetical protein
MLVEIMYVIALRRRISLFTGSGTRGATSSILEFIPPMPGPVPHIVEGKPRWPGTLAYGT